MEKYLEAKKALGIETEFPHEHILNQHNIDPFTLTGKAKKAVEDFNKFLVDTYERFQVNPETVDAKDINETLSYYSEIAFNHVMDVVEELHETENGAAATGSESTDDNNTTSENQKTEDTSTESTAQPQLNGNTTSTANTTTVNTPTAQPQVQTTAQQPQSQPQQPQQTTQTVQQRTASQKSSGNGLLWGSLAALFLGAITFGVVRYNQNKNGSGK